MALGSALAWFLLQSVKLTFLRATALAGLWGVLAGALSLTAPVENGEQGEQRSPAWTWAVSLVIGADLIVAGWGQNPGVLLDFYSQASSTANMVRQMAGGGRLYLPDGDEYVLKFNRFFEFSTYSAVQDWTELRAALLPDIFMLDGLDSANNFDPLVPARYANWMHVLSNLPPVKQLGTDTPGGLPGESSLVEIPAGISSAVFERMLNLMGVRVVERVDHRSPDNVRFEPVLSSSGAGVQSARTFRLRWADCVLPAADASQALSLVTAGDTDLNGKVVLEGAAAPATGWMPYAASGVLWHGCGIHLTGLKFRCTPAIDGWLVLSDVWYPGWQATLDGIAVPVEKADYLFRAVAVPAGAHLVRFSYRPLSFYLGAVISLIAVLGLALGFSKNMNSLEM